MSFDAIAPHYRWLEWVAAGSLLQRCRTAFIPEIKRARNILLLGEGRGCFLTALLRCNPAARVTSVDASARMLQLTQTGLLKRGLPIDRIRFVHANIHSPDWDREPEGYDVVASHFFLDCFRPDQLQQIVSTVAAATVPHAGWLLSDFCLPKKGWSRWRAQLILSGMYAFFRMATQLSAKRLTAPDQSLQRAGFQLRHRQYFNHGLLHSDFWEKT